MTGEIVHRLEAFRGCCTASPGWQKWLANSVSGRLDTVDAYAPVKPIAQDRPPSGTWCRNPPNPFAGSPKSTKTRSYSHHVGPSGYGKTTLVAQFLRATQSRVAWLEAVPDDADVLHFARSLEQTLARTLPDTPPVEVTSLLMASPPASLLGAAFKSHLRTLDALELVIDNVEYLGAESRSWLSDLLEADLGTTRIWLIGYDLEHLRLARLVARGAAMIVYQNDLRFDTQETRGILEAYRSTENPEEVCSRLDGWPAGVGLIAMGISPQITPTHLIFDALDQLPAALRDHLPEAAVLEVWTERAAQDIGCAIPVGWLQRLRRSGLPLTELEPETYRPHRTLLEALEQRLRGNPERHRALHAAAAHQLLNRQETLGAIRHYLMASERPAALKAAEPFAMRLSARGEHTLVYQSVRTGFTTHTDALGVMGRRVDRNGAN
ncbi:MAG: AAA family ATPase [Pleurocapsa sp. SU_196_0]|nr:AAA family ATPase [Pleurocapsa sp. SU_196_0]